MVFFSHFILHLLFPSFICIITILNQNDTLSVFYFSPKAQNYQLMQLKVCQMKLKIYKTQIEWFNFLPSIPSMNHCSSLLCSCQLWFLPTVETRDLGPQKYSYWITEVCPFFSLLCKIIPGYYIQLIVEGIR